MQLETAVGVYMACHYRQCVVEQVQLLAVQGLCFLCFEALHDILVILLPLPTEDSTSYTHDCHQKHEGCNNNLLFGGEILCILLL